MGARTLTSKFTQVHVSAVRRPGNSIGVGIVFRTRQGANVRKTAYALRDVSLEQATYEAILTALDEATRVNARGPIVYVDSPKVVAQLNRTAQTPPELRALFVQVRCRANGLRRVRFRLARPGQNFAARRLARAATTGEQPVNIEYDNVLLSLSFTDDRPIP